MHLTLFKMYVFLQVMAVPLVSAFAEDIKANEDRIARLEARLLELESRLSEIEKDAAQSVSDQSGKRIAELEARLAETEQEAASPKQQQGAKEDISTINDRSQPVGLSKIALTNGASHNPKWMEAEQWVEIQPGISMEQVIELLGPPPRTLQSLKPRVDEVFCYESSFRRVTNPVQGKISFRKGKVISVLKPDFDLNNQID